MIEKNEVSVNARGGTELYNEWMEKNLDKSYFEKFQIIPTRVREIDPSRKPILVVHETPWDGQVQNLADPEYRRQFAGIVFVSNWQRQMFNVCLGVPFSETTVIPHAFDIEPFSFGSKPVDGPIRISYHSMPNRGLEILIPVFESITKTFPEFDIHLDIYSSFATYGAEQADAPFKEFFEIAKNHPRITYHGAVSNEVLVERLKITHIHAYPNIYAETFCRAVVESMLSGVIVVCPDYGALPDTTARTAAIYEFTEDKAQHAIRFGTALLQTIQAITTSRTNTEHATVYNNYIIKSASIINSLYNSTLIKQKWQNYMDNIK